MSGPQVLAGTGSVKRVEAPVRSVNRDDVGCGAIRASNGHGVQQTARAITERLATERLVSGKIINPTGGHKVFRIVCPRGCRRPNRRIKKVCGVCERNIKQRCLRERQMSHGKDKRENCNKFLHGVNLLIIP